MTDGARWQRLNSLFHGAVAQPAGLRQTFLLTECSDDPALRAEVESLLAMHRDGDGEMLADRIARGRLPVEEALRIARQIADALEAAHERGVIHRDLKPASVTITRDGAVKVQTGPGHLLGTPAYMSPEQARGEAADQRSDIWAFGCVLYEMLTGTSAFQGATVADTLAYVLASEPRLDALPKSLPDTVRTLVVRCLVKDRAQRIPHASVIRFLLNEPPARPESWRAWTLSVLQNRTSRVVVILAILLLFSVVRELFRYFMSVGP